MKKLVCSFVVLAMLFIALPAHSRGGFPIKLCNDESESTGPGTCRFIRFLQGNSAGLGTISLMPTASALYRWDSASSRFVRWDGTAGSVTTPGVIRLMDGVGVALSTVFGAHADGLANTENGLNTASFLYGFNGTTWDRLDTGTHADGMSNATTGLNTASFNYGYNGTTWDRIDAFTHADNVANTVNGSNTSSFLYAFDSATWDRLTLNTYSDALQPDQAGLDVISYNTFLDGTASLTKRWEGDPAGDALSATQIAPYTLGLNLFYDGTNHRRWQGITMADNLTHPTAPFVGSVLLASDGATLDMVKVGATGAVEVEDTSTRAGEDAGNGLRWVGLKATTEYEPAKTTTTGIGAASTQVLAPVDVSGQKDCCVYLQNDDGANPFTDALIMFGPNTTDMPTVGNGSWTACDSLAAGEVCFYCWDDAHAAVEVEVTGAGGATVDVDAWLVCKQ